MKKAIINADDDGKTIMKLISKHKVQGCIILFQ